MYHIFKKLKISDITAIILSTLFIVHPINLEAISYISGVADPLSLFFMLLGLLTFHSQIPFRKKIIALVFLFILSLLSKESSVIFPFLIIALFVFDANKFEPKNIFILSSLGVILFSYLILKFTVFKFTGNFGLSSEGDSSFFNRVITFIGSLPEYVSLLFYPKDLYIERPYFFYNSLYEFKILLGVIITLVFASIFYFFKDKVLRYGILCLFIAFIPFVGILPLNAIYLEHWFYTPFFGFLLILGCFLEYIKQKKIVVFGALLIIPLLVIRSRQRNTEWKTPELFYSNELSYAPNNTRMLNNAGNVYLRKNDFKSAASYYNQVLEINPNNTSSLINLSIVRTNLNNYESSEALLLKVIRLNKNMVSPYYQLHKIYKLTNNNKKKEVINTIFHKIASYGISSLTEEDVQQLLQK